MPAQVDFSSSGFGSVAQGLARNPLGIIALFIVLVYGFASLVVGFGGDFTESERIPLVYFLVIFPVLVLAVFAWLVSKHSGKLFAPGDFQDEENYIRMQVSAVTSLSAASAKDSGSFQQADLQELIEVVRSASVRPAGGRGHDHVLWVDDNPSNNVYERSAFEAVGLRFTLAESTQEALAEIAKRDFAAIISDMGRREGPREGYVLLDTLRSHGNETPLFFYASSNAPEHKRETAQHGGQGCTNNAQELFRMGTRSVIEGRA